MSDQAGQEGSILVVDVGTSGVRGAIVRPNASVEHAQRVAVPAITPAAGQVELDARAIASAVLDVATAVLEAGGPVAGVGIANQRASTIVWERATGEPVGPAIGWQDLRTVITCLTMQADGFRLPPNASATKVAAILDEIDPQRHRADELCFGTVDSWVAWVLSGGAGGEALHVTDATNAAVTWLTTLPEVSWDPKVLDALRIPASMLPAIVDSSGFIGTAAALPGAPPICGIAGDQQASLVGQGCLRPGLAKATFGTGAMLDLCTGRRPASVLDRGPQGTFPIVAWRRSGESTWGIEALMLTAGACVAWLAEDLGLLSSPKQSDDVAAQCVQTPDLWFVPALLGLGTPVWDFGARGTFLGISAGVGRSELVRAVLEGVAHRGADLLEAAESDGGLSVDALRVDGGMSRNRVFVQELANAIGRPVDVSSEPEATTLGAGFLAGMAAGTWRDEDDVADAYAAGERVEPTIDPEAGQARRARWLEARSRSQQTIPELSTISF
jgi:glycerol kinase